jgi:hypothetical protein
MQYSLFPSQILLVISVSAVFIIIIKGLGGAQFVSLPEIDTGVEAVPNGIRRYAPFNIRIGQNPLEIIPVL